MTSLGYLQWHDCLVEVAETFPNVFDVHKYSFLEIFHFINIVYKTSSLHTTTHQKARNLKSEIQWSKQVPLWAELSLNTWHNVWKNKANREWERLWATASSSGAVCGLSSSYWFTAVSLRDFLVSDVWGVLNEYLSNELIGIIIKQNWPRHLDASYSHRK